MNDRVQIPDFLAVDFYCGAGGTTRGLIDAGGYVIAGVDKDAACRQTYLQNNPNETLDKESPTFIQKDMFPVSSEYPDGEQNEILGELRHLITSYQTRAQASAGRKVPLLFAVCAPCQSFTKFVQRSLTDRRATGRERDRNLLAQALTFISEFQPDMVLSENVAGIGHGQYGQVWQDFKNELRRMGYRVGNAKVNAHYFGVPQRRRRFIILAAKASAHERVVLELPMPNGHEDNELTVRNAIGKLPPLQAGGKDAKDTNHQCRNLIEINRRRLLAVPPGKSNFAFGNDLALACHRRLDTKGKRGFGDVYTRVHPDRPAPTITTRFHSVSNGRFGHYDENQARGLSLREGALLQSFPQGYEFYADGMDTIARMIGNAVPPKLAKYMAEYLCEVWLEEQATAVVSSQGNT